MGSIFSSTPEPNFFLAFGALRTPIGKYIDQYSISDVLDEKNLAQVFIEKINGDDKLLPKDKISRLKDVLGKINIMKLGPNSNRVLQEIKKAHEIIEKNRNRYVSEIEEAIKKIQLSNVTAKRAPVTAANANANANANAKRAPVTAANANANANAFAAVTASSAEEAAETATTTLVANVTASSALLSVPQNAANAADTAKKEANNAATPAANPATLLGPAPLANNTASSVALSLPQSTENTKNANSLVKNSSSEIKPLSQNDETLYSGIITKLKKLRDEMDKKIGDRFKEKTSEYNKQKKDQKIKKKPIKPSLQGIGSDPVYRLITLFLIIQKLRGKLDNTSNNSTQLDTQLKILIKNYIYKLPEDTISGKNKIKQITDLKNVGSTDELIKLKGEISKKKDSEIIKEFNEDIAKLFAEYIEAKNGQYIIDLPQLKGSSNNSQSNSNPVESSNQNQPHGSKSGGSRKKSKKSRS